VDEIYHHNPNGGIFILSVQGEKVNAERLIFVKPKETLNVGVETDRAGYEPGDKVTLTVKTDKPTNATSDELFYASVKISDLSSYLKVQSYEQPPNLQEMVFLEKELKHQNGELDEFKYADDYLALSSASSEKDGNLDLILACQAWRKNLFDDEDTIRDLVNGAEGDVATLYEYLQGMQNPFIAYKYYLDGFAPEMQEFEAMEAPTATRAVEAPPDMEVDEDDEEGNDR
jgi:hypothetical protein